MFAVYNNILEINIDEILKQDLTTLDKKVVSYTKEILHYFLGNVGYGKQHDFKTLSYLRHRYNLNYEKISLTYKGKEYTIAYSSKSDNHGKVKGFKYYNLTYNRPPIEPLNEFDILIPSFDRQDRSIGLKMLSDGISSDKFSNHPNYLVSRDFLSHKFNFFAEYYLAMFLNYHYINLQEQQDNQATGNIEELDMIIKALESKGFKYNTYILNEDEVKKSFFSNKQLLIGINVTDNNNRFSFEGGVELLKACYYEYWKLMIDFYVVNSVKHRDKRGIQVNIHYY